MSGSVTRDLTKPSLARLQLCMELWNLWWGRDSSGLVRQVRLEFFLRMMFSWKHQAGRLVGLSRLSGQSDININISINININVSININLTLTLTSTLTV